MFDVATNKASVNPAYSISFIEVSFRIYFENAIINYFILIGGKGIVTFWVHPINWIKKIKN